MLLVKGVPRLKGDLKTLRNLEEMENTPRRKLRAKMQVVDYLMGNANGNGVGLVRWYQRMLVSETGELTPLYQGKYSNYR